MVAKLTGTLTTAAPTQVNAVNVLLASGNQSLSAASLNATRQIAIDTLRVEDTGNHEQVTADFEILDKTLAYAAMRGEWKVQVVDSSGITFRGFVRQNRGTIEAIYGGVVVTAYDAGTLLDSLIVDAPATRKNSESMKARLAWFLSTFAQPLMQEGLDYDTKVKPLLASMPDQKFPTHLTVRQGVERILSGASDSSNYYLDPSLRLHVFDADNAESSIDAPYDINVKSAPSASEVAPMALEVEWDSHGLVNGYFVTGANAAGSGWYSEKDPALSMSGPWSMDLFGIRKHYLSAPDADTVAKAQRVVKAAIRDTRNPIPRGTFTVEGASCVNGSLRWQGGQLVYVTSATHNLTGRSADPGPWAGAIALQPFRIVRVATHYLNGAGDRRMEIEFGGRRPHLYSA